MFVMFSFHEYMVEHHNSLEDEAPTKRPTIGVTRLRQLVIRRGNGQKTLTDIGVNPSIATSPNAYVFKSYLGMLVRERISILTPSFGHVIEVDQNMIWQDLLVTNINVITLIL